MSQEPARRGFLRQSIAILPVAALTGAAHTQNSPPAPATVPTLASGPLPAPAPYVPAYFTAAEWAFVTAAVSRLIPSDETGPGAVESGVPEFIDRQMNAVFGHGSQWYMQGPFVESAPEFGYQGKAAPRDVYRAAIAAVDGYCKSTFSGKAFADLTGTQQDTVLKGLESGDVKLDNVPGKTFFGFLLQNTKEGYLSDPIHGGNRDAGAWKMIGFPGSRADFADWVGRPGVRYPLPPVTISGPQG